jgi:hypothetical protein
MPPQGARLLRLFAKDVTLSAVSWMQWLCAFLINKAVSLKRQRGFVRFFKLFVLTVF